MATIESCMIAGFQVSGYMSSNGTESGMPASQVDNRWARRVAATRTHPAPNGRVPEVHRRAIPVA